MNWTAAIEMQREALKRVVAALVAMAGCAGDSSGSRDGAPATLPRHLHRAVLRLLRPAESAARRLAIALARGLPAPPAPRPRQNPSGPASAGRAVARKTSPIFVRHGVGTGIVLRPGAPVPPCLAHLASAKPARRPVSFALLDPLPRWRARRRPRAAGTPPIGTPRIGMSGGRAAVPAWRPPLPGDPLDAGRLGGRLAALARALDDLPGLALRFQRWKARRDRALAAGRIHRVMPLRGGRPPGGRLAQYDPDRPRRKNIRDVDEILAHAHALARHALRPDTS